MTAGAGAPTGPGCRSPLRVVLDASVTLVGDLPCILTWVGPGLVGSMSIVRRPSRPSSSTGRWADPGRCPR